MNAYELPEMSDEQLEYLMQTQDRSYKAGYLAGFYQGKQTVLQVIRKVVAEVKPPPVENELQAK
jgi:hypothetical protein